MTAVRRCTDLSSLPSPAPLLSRLSSAASRLLQMRKYGSRKEDGGRLRNGRSSSASRPGFIDPSSWKYFDSRAVGIPAGAIPRNCMTVLQMLKRKGFEAYLVGGCVRDLLLKRAPKDFDVITTASLKQVSSFKTNTTQVKGNENVNCSEETDGHDEGDILRWKDSLRRDFTVNSLFFNPFNYRVYDYVNGVKDLRKNKTRLAMEMKYMLSYGAAESSIRLLRKYGLLDILLPFQAAYLSDQLKGKSSDRGLMLMNLLANLDKFFSADRPCHCSLWLALLAFHNALVNSPQDAQVIKAFAALMHFGTWDIAIEFLNEDVGAPVTYVPEAFGRSGAKVDNLMERTSHLASLVKSSVDTLTCLNTLKQSVVRYPGASQFSGLVFVSAREKGRVLGIFNGLDSDLTSYDKRRGSHGIDYKLLEDGVTAEVRFVLGKVIMDTMSAESPCASTDDAAALPRAAADVTDADHRPLSMLFRSGESE
ncbi:putative poly(A) polymerase [Triticum urartu]|uniref:Putative poly(A) polymerase n=1 Tax=Triticum urartu TaxID=4572 RepID=M7ZD38_TRIUA|nr:putative poly(A) polymerase [Triticum urartu]